MTDKTTTLPNLPIEIEELVWEKAKSNIRKTLKARAWQEIHNELKTIVAHKKCKVMLIPVLMQSPGGPGIYCVR